MPWADEAQPSVSGRWADDDIAPSPAPARQSVTVKSTEEMPGVLEALGRGVRGSFSDVGRTVTSFSSVAPEPEAPSPLTEPFEWRDVTEPSRGAAKIMHGLGRSAPTLGAGLAGGVAGLAGGPAGALAGGAAGAAIGTVMQTIGPIFAQELKKSPDDPEGAWSRSVQHGLISGAASGAGWALFPVRFFQGPLKQAAFQIFGVQPAVSVGEKAATNIVHDRPTYEGATDAYLHGAAGTAIPMAGHAAISGIGRGLGIGRSRAEQRASEPDVQVLNDLAARAQVERVKRMIEGDPQLAQKMQAAAQAQQSAGNPPNPAVQFLPFGAPIPPPGAPHIPPSPGGGTPPPGGHPPGGTSPPGQLPPWQAHVRSRWKPGEDPSQPLDLYTKVKDDLNPLRRAEQEIAGQKLRPDESPYVLARLTRGLWGRVQHFFDHGTYNWNTGATNGEGLRQILAPIKGRMNDFTDYLVAKRAIEKDAQGIQTGVDIPSAHRVVSNFRATFEPVAQRIYDYQDRVLRLLLDSGVISQDQYAAIRRANRDYVPFYRLVDGNMAGPQAGGRSLSPFLPIRRMKGSGLEIVSPLESIMRNTAVIVETAERNRVMRKLADLADASPNQRVMERVKAPVHPIGLSQQEIDRLFRQAGIPSQLGINPSDFTIFRPNAFRPERDVISVFRDGKRQLYRVRDVALADAIAAMDQPSMGIIQKILSSPAKLLRAGVTLVPEFFIRNLARDQLSAFAFSKNGYLPLWSSMVGMKNIFGGKFESWLNSRSGSNAVLNAISGVLGRGDAYKEWLKSGAANAALVSGDRQYMENMLRRMVGEAVSGKTRLKNILSSPIDALRAASELFENATRVGEFALAQKKGKSIHESGFDAREVTLDFWRVGSQTRALNNIVAFWNAQLEGVDRAGRALFSEGASRSFGVGLRAVGGIMVPSLLLWAANRDKDRYKETAQWEKDVFWHVFTDKWTPISADDATMIPDGKDFKRQGSNGQWYKNDGEIYRIPKPFEIGVMFGSVPERIFEAFIQDNPDAFRNLQKTLGQAFLSFLPPPIGTSMPQFAAPMLEHFANKSFFLDRPLVGKSLGGLDPGSIQPKYKYNEYTTETAKGIGSAVAALTDLVPATKGATIASPIILENYIRAWTGTMGMYALRGSDALARASGIVPAKVEPVRKTADLPFFRAFVSRYPSANAESIQKFYNAYDERKSGIATARHLGKIGEVDEAERVRSREPQGNVDRIYRTINSLHKVVKDTYRRKDLTAEEKRNMIDNSYLRMIDLARIGYSNLRETEKEFRRGTGSE